MAQEEHTVTNNPVRVQNVAVNLRPASVGPSPRAKPALSFDAEQSTAENHTSRGSRQRRGRGGARDGGRGGGRGGARVGYSDVNGGQVVVNTHNHSVDRDHQARRGNYGPRQLNQAISTNVPTRQFGGRLTTEGESHEASSPVSTLQADAPEFTPGQQIGAHAHRWNQNRRGRGSTNALPRVSNGRLPRLRRGSSLKSTAPDIATRTHEDISNGLYECPICTSEVARNSKDQNWLKLQRWKEICRLRGNGGARGATCRKKLCQQLILAGVRRRTIRNQSPACRRILVVRRVVSTEYFPRNVPTLVTSNVTLDLVLPAHIWVQARAAFVASKLPQENVSRQITKVAGAVKKDVEKSCHVGITLAHVLVTKVSVALVKFPSMHVATVASLKSASYARTKMTKRKASRLHTTKAVCRLWTVG
ncbi:hypothetical protein MMC09_005238 [Bachmanniomyces sp. S44760]|nr:hypothetical protein [Bachmanniomyces sp. S44760]